MRRQGNWGLELRGDGLDVSQLEQVIVGWFPPAVRTRAGEYLFVHATRARELAEAAAQAGLAFVERLDLWSYILEEFLDTSFSEESQQRTLELLERNGVSRAEVAELRELVKEPMLRLTAATWEWVHYGLFDLLCAMEVKPGSAFAARVMEVADRGPVKPSSREALERLFPPAET
ncbi:MAG: hypothetical protein AB1938_03950 [Myxococcota bacterium]